VTRVDGNSCRGSAARVAFWLGVNDSDNNFIQVGEITHSPGCPTKVQLFAQAYDTLGNQILNWAGPCGVTWSGAGQFITYNSGLVNKHYRYLFSGPSGTHADACGHVGGKHRFSLPRRERRTELQRGMHLTERE
jgi:hypothetical protein